MRKDEAELLEDILISVKKLKKKLERLKWKHKKFK